MTGTDGKTVLITGASSGIGEAAALALAARGHRVLAGVRRAADAERLAPRLGATGQALIIDVTRPEQIAAARAAVEAADGLDALVNNAGVTISGPLEHLPLDDIRQQFEVNVFGVIALTQAMLPSLRRSRGRVIVVGSVGGRNAMPLIAPYCASKHAIEALAPALRMELKRAGVAVSLVEPGSTSSAIWDTSIARSRVSEAMLPADALQQYGPALEALRTFAGRIGKAGSPPRVVARAIVNAVESRRPKRRYIVGADARAQLLLGGLPAAWREPFLQRLLLPGPNA
ncbi:MAG TPA: SDR family oxidoreductase [Caulobacteraceae bacterium]|nr:SDR family oxidoreductase [Caulobacteraceae bacterium]